MISGRSTLFKSWNRYINVTERCFLSALKWLTEDPEPKRHTRELGLANGTLYRLTVIYDSSGKPTRYTQNMNVWLGHITATIDDI